MRLSLCPNYLQRCHPRTCSRGSMLSNAEMVNESTQLDSSERAQACMRGYASLRAGSAARRVFRQDALQGAPMHAQAAGGFRDIAIALLIDPLDMFPAHAIGRHRLVPPLRPRWT